MICPQCRKDGIELGDSFCRHCGFSVPKSISVPESAGVITENKPAAATGSSTGKGLGLLGAAMFFFVAIFVIAAAPLMGWSNFGDSALPWVSGALMVAGLALMFVGFALHQAR